MERCQHCEKATGQTRRGLCRTCYAVPAIRRLYRTAIVVPTHEPTEAELDELIAQQRKCLPKWWNREIREGFRRRG
jgi:hypothetical protein